MERKNGTNTKSKHKQFIKKFTVQRQKNKKESNNRENWEYRAREITVAEIHHAVIYLCIKEEKIPEYWTKAIVVLNFNK